MRRCNNMGCLLKPIIGLIKMILMIIGLIVVILAIFIGIVFWQLSGTPALEGRMHEVIATAEDGQAFDAAVDQLKADLLNPAILAGTPVELRLTEKMVTGKIMEAIEDADIPIDVKDVWVNFAVDEETGEKNQVLILGKVAVGLTLTAGLVLEMVPVEEWKNPKKPEVKLDDVAIKSGWIIPGSVKEQIANQIPTADALTDMVKDFPVDWSNISIEGTDLVFAGKKATGPII